MAAKKQKRDSRRSHKRLIFHPRTGDKKHEIGRNLTLYVSTVIEGRVYRYYCTRNGTVFQTGTAISQTAAYSAGIAWF